MGTLFAPLVPIRYYYTNIIGLPPVLYVSGPPNNEKQDIRLATQPVPFIAVLEFNIFFREQLSLNGGDIAAVLRRKRTRRKKSQRRQRKSTL